MIRRLRIKFVCINMAIVLVMLCAMFLTVLYVFGGMLFKVWRGDLMSADSSTFLIFLIINVLCLEFGMKKSAVDRLFRRDGR